MKSQYKDQQYRHGTSKIDHSSKFPLQATNNIKRAQNRHDPRQYVLRIFQLITIYSNLVQIFLD